MKSESAYETVLSIATVDGREEELVVHPSLVDDSVVEVLQVQKRDSDVLIELPQESARGNWRILVPSAIIEGHGA